MNFALQQSGISPIREIRIKNKTGRALSGLSVSVSSDPAIFRQKSFPIEELSPRTDYEITSLELSMNPALLITLTAPQDAHLQVALTMGDEVLSTVESEIRLLAYDEWPGLTLFPETTGALIQPGHPYISDILKSASGPLKHLTKESSFSGYKSKNPDLVRSQMEAIYAALQTERFRTTDKQPDYEAPEQKIRLAETLRNKRDCTTLQMLPQQELLKVEHIKNRQ